MPKMRRTTKPRLKWFVRTHTKSKVSNQGGRSPATAQSRDELPTSEGNVTGSHLSECVLWKSAGRSLRLDARRPNIALGNAKAVVALSHRETRLVTRFGGKPLFFGAKPDWLTGRRRVGSLARDFTTQYPRSRSHASPASKRLTRPQSFFSYSIARTRLATCCAKLSSAFLITPT